MGAVTITEALCSCSSLWLNTSIWRRPRKPSLQGTGPFRRPLQCWVAFNYKELIWDELNSSWRITALPLQVYAKSWKPLSRIPLPSPGLTQNDKLFLSGALEHIVYQWYHAAQVCGGKHTHTHTREMLHCAASSAFGNLSAKSQAPKSLDWFSVTSTFFLWFVTNACACLLCESIWSPPPACSQGQTAVSLHSDTWVIQGQSLNGAAEAWVLWLVHWIHAWRPETQKTECTSGLQHYCSFTRKALTALNVPLLKNFPRSVTRWLKRDLQIQIVTMSCERRIISNQQTPWLWQVWSQEGLPRADPGGEACHQFEPLSRPSSLLWCSPLGLHSCTKDVKKKAFMFNNIAVTTIGECPKQTWNHCKISLGKFHDSHVAVDHAKISLRRS